MCLCCQNSLLLTSRVVFIACARKSVLLAYKFLILRVWLHRCQDFRARVKTVHADNIKLVMLFFFLDSPV